MKQIYLDNNATTPVLARVVEAMQRAARDRFANPASQHASGRRARAVLETAREQIARMLGAQVDSLRADRLIFTSGGTEANNLALCGLTAGRTGHLLVSAIEHPSVIETADQLARRGWQVERIPVDGNGVVRLDSLTEMIRPETRLVSVMLGNNETGVLQPVAEIVKLCRSNGTLIHSDATQVVGKLPVRFEQLDVDALTFAAHKFHGPVGIGALLLRSTVEVAPMLHGGFQQSGVRPGTEPVVLAAGMQEALTAWHEAPERTARQLAEMRDELERLIRSELPEAVVLGQAAPRLPHTSNLAFPALDRQALVMALDLAGIACSTGSACASGSSEPSPVLLAMGLPDHLVEGSIRFSLGALNTAAEVNQAAERIISVCNDLRQQKRSRKMAESSPGSAGKRV